MVLLALVDMNVSQAFVILLTVTQVHVHRLRAILKMYPAHGPGHTMVQLLMLVVIMLILYVLSVALNVRMVSLAHHVPLVLTVLA